VEQTGASGFGDLQPTGEYSAKSMDDTGQEHTIVRVPDTSADVSSMKKNCCLNLVQNIIWESVFVTV
jgi:hypothetical protein